MRMNFLAMCVTVLGLSTTTLQAAHFVTNGGFEATTNGNGQLGFNTSATGWTGYTNANVGYTFLFTPGTADTTGAVGEFGGVRLWGPGEHDGPANGLGSSPDGGNFIASDGAYNVGPVQQTITGLTKGQEYNVSFDWAGAQQYGYHGRTTEQWDVSLGSQTFDTAVAHDGSHGFTGWMQQTFVFTAPGPSEVLSFLAVGTPHGQPPFALLDGVSMTAVPEPASWTMIILGIGGIGAAMRLAQGRNGLPARA